MDDDNHLEGVLSLRQLLLASPDATLKSLAREDVYRVYTDTDQEEVARLVSRYDLLALPVVDQENRLLGIVTVDDVIDVIRAVFLKGAGLRELWIQFVVLGFMAVTTLAIATHRFRAALR